MSVMLYKAGKRAKLHNIDCDYIVVNECDVDDYIKDGWLRTTSEVAEVAEVAEESSKKAKGKK